jgi:hypothetical protein
MGISRRFRTTESLPANTVKARSQKARSAERRSITLLMSCSENIGPTKRRQKVQIAMTEQVDPNTGRLVWRLQLFAVVHAKNSFLTVLPRVLH